LRSDREPDSAKMSACNQVLNTTELLEGILVLLPLPDLLRCQAVTQQWRTVIASSLPIQQKLFLKPIKAETAWLVDITNLPAQRHPLRRDFKARMRVKAAVPLKSPQYKSHYGLSTIPVKLNRLLMQRTPQMRAHGFKDLTIDQRVDQSTTMGIGSLLQTLSKLEIKQHIFMDMLLTQPPVTEAVVSSWSAGEGLVNDRNHTIQIQEDEGVRLNHVMNELNNSLAGQEALFVDVLLNGVVSPSEEDEALVAERTVAWRKELEESGK
jgi:hypothetical protein